MSGYSFAVNGTAVSGSLIWNANGSLRWLNINDPFNAGNTGTCYPAYDDLERLGQVDCGPGNWGQVFRYDAFGNIDKSNGAGQTGVNFLPTYATLNPTNQYMALPPGVPVYDGDGNLTNDGFCYYAWDADGKTIRIDKAVADVMYGTGRPTRSQAQSKKKAGSGNSAVTGQQIQAICEARVNGAQNRRAARSCETAPCEALPRAVPAAQLAGSGELAAPRGSGGVRERLVHIRHAASP